MNMRERIARAIAQGLGDDYDKAFAGKSEWTAARGEVAGAFRDINQPYRTDYDDAADAALAAMAGPTKAMIEAGNLPGWDDCVTIGLSEAVWTVMLAAAGEPE